MLQYVLAEHPFFVATTALYAASAALYASAWRSTKALVGRAATAQQPIGAGLHRTAATSDARRV